MLAFRQPRSRNCNHANALLAASRCLRRSAFGVGVGVRRAACAGSHGTSIFSRAMCPCRCRVGSELGSELAACEHLQVQILNVCAQVVYFTALFPYAVMIIFFVRAVTLNGFQHGLYYLYFPKVCTTE